jgi:Family of unknown function (DUF6311)
MPRQSRRQRSSSRLRFLPHLQFSLQWPDSLTVNLIIAGAFGSSYSLLVLGPARIDPRNLSWLGGDAATYYIGWELFRQDMALHWPLTFTDRVGYPVGDSIAFMDPIPLLAILLKPLSVLVPTSFQYLGIATVLAVSLQFFFAARLFQLLLGRNMFGVLLPSLFFLLAPPMTWRIAVHFALVNHWLLVAALCLFVSLQRGAGEMSAKPILYCGLLGAVAVGINPYLTLMVVVLVIAGVITAWWKHRLRSKTACGMLAATGGACLIVALASGLIRGGGGYGIVDYREYALNVLAPIDPGPFGGLFMSSISPIPYRTNESYNYLGAGVLMLVALMLPSLSPRRLRGVTAGDVVPLAVGCLVLTALAVSTKISLGPFLIADIDPHESLATYLSPLRGSARLFWAPYYVMLTAILAMAFTIWHPRHAAILVTLALLVQFVDTVPLRKAVREQVSQSWPRPLRSPHWSSLSLAHANLLVLPPWQCWFFTRKMETPGGEDGYRIFGMLAVSQRMRINSYYAGRYSPGSLAYHCDEALNDLKTQPLSPDSVYVVSPSVASVIAFGPTGPTACHPLDGFIVCSTKMDGGLTFDSPGEVPAMYASGRIESWADAVDRGYLIGGWHDPEPGGIWSQGYGILQFRLSAEQSRRYHAASLRLAAPVGINSVKYRILSGRHVVASGTFPGGAVPRVEMVELQVPLQHTSHNIETVTLITQDAVRPFEIGFNNDPRLLGLGLQGVTLVP